MTDHQFSHLWSESRPRTACPGPARSKTPPAGVRAARPRRCYLQPWIPLLMRVEKYWFGATRFARKANPYLMGILAVGLMASEQDPEDLRPPRHAVLFPYPS